VSRLPWSCVVVGSHKYFGSSKGTLRFPEIKSPAFKFLVRMGTTVVSKPQQWGGLDPTMKRKRIHAPSFLFDYFRHDRSWQLALPKLVKELPLFLEPKSSLMLFTTARHYSVPEPCVSPLHLHTHCSLIYLLIFSFCTLRSLLVYYVWIFQLMCFTPFLFLSSVLHVWSISAF
jgi:hypothetical protein